MDRKLKILFLLLLSFNFLKAQVVYPPAGAGGTNLDVSGTASPLTVRSSTGTDIDLIGGTNTTLVGTPTSITINSTSGGDILNGGNTTGAAVTIGTNDNNALNFETNSVTRLTVANGVTTGGALTSTNVNANTGTAVDALTLSTNSTGTPVAGFGTGILFKAESNTTNDREIARFYTYYTDPTNATPSTAASIDLRNAGSLAETFRFEPAGILKVGSTSPTDFGKSGITTGVAFTVGNSANDLTIGGNSGVVDINSSGTAAAIKLNASGTTSYIEVGGTANATNTSGQKASMWFPQGYSASTGTGIFTGIYLNGTINQTGSANGLTAGIFIDQPVTAAADYSGLLIGTTGATTKAIHQTSSTATNIIRGKTAFGTSTAPTAHLHLESGSTILAPFKFTQGSNLTTPEPGAVEWNGTNLFITQTSGPTRKQIAYTTDITSGYTTMQEEGAGLTARAILNFIGSSATAADDGSSKTNVTFDSDLNALASTASTGLYSVTGTGTSAVRTITGPAAGITVSNGNGVSGNPTLALANDLSAVEGLATNGIPARTATDTWTVRTITAGTGISVTNGDGVAGNPTISLSGGAAGDIVNGGNTTGAAVTIGTNDNNALNLETNNVTRFSIASGASTGGAITATNITANTSTNQDALTLSTNSSGSAGAGFGTGILFKGETSGIDNTDMGRLKMVYDAVGGSEQAGFAIELNSLGTVAQAAKFDRFGTLSTGRSTPTQYGGPGVGIVPASDLLINTTTANNTYVGGGTGRVRIRSSGSGTYGIEMGVTNPSSGGWVAIGVDDGSTLTSTSTTTADKPILELKHGFAAASGGNRPIGLLISNALDQTGSAFGVMTGIKINPTLTNVANTYRAIDIVQNHSSSKGIYQSGTSTTNNFVGKTYFGSTSSPTALVQVGAGTTTVAPIILTSGTNLTTPAAGALEWNGTNLFATQTSGPTRKTVAYTSDIGAETVVSPTSFSTDQNNYNPTDLATATTLRLTTSVNLLMITGITAPSVAKSLTLINIGSNTILLTAQDASSSAANRFQFFRDIPLYPGCTVVLVYDLTSAVWRSAQGNAEVAQLSQREFNTQYSVFGAATPVGVTVSTTDATITAPTETNGALSNLAPGGGTASNAYFYTSSNSLFPFFISSTVRTSLYFEGTIVTPANLSDATNNYSVACGFASTVGTSEPLGANLFYNHSVSTAWQGYTKGAGNSVISTGITFSASTKYKLGVQVRPDFTVAYFINDAYVGETSTNIPTSRTMVAGIQIYKNAGTSRTLQFVEMEAFQIR